MDQTILKDFIEVTTNSVNKLHKDLSNVYSLRYKFLIHGLVKKGLVKVTDIELTAGLSSTNVYKIIDEVDKLIKEYNEKV